MNQTEILILVVCILVFLVGVILLFVQKIKGSKKSKKSKKSKDVIADIKDDKPSRKSKHLRPVVLTAEPVEKKEEKPDLTSDARDAENTDTISLEKPKRTDDDLIDIEEIKTFIDERPRSVTRSSRPREHAPRPPRPMQIFDDEADAFEDDILPADMPQYNTPNFDRNKAPSGESEFLRSRGDEKRIYDELKNMSPEMKKIIMADILKRRDH